MTTAPYSVLVNSSDGFEDCWRPFFALFERFWPDCPAPIVLNTEQKTWSPPRLEVRCTCVQSPGVPRLTWSECLVSALDSLTTPLVLYLQEDYFLEALVNTAFVNELAALMLRKPEIRHIGLTEFGSMGPFTPTDDDRLWKISQRAPYRLSTQAGLWRVDTLREHLRAYENGWMFELYGSRRAWRRAELFLTVNRDMFAGAHRAFPYSHTGIIKGKWHPTMPRLFEAHGINVDFTKRGFFVPKPRWLQRLYTAKRLIARPSAFFAGLAGR